MLVKIENKLSCCLLYFGIVYHKFRSKFDDIYLKDLNVKIFFLFFIIVHSNGLVLLVQWFFLDVFFLEMSYHSVFIKFLSQSINN